MGKYSICYLLKEESSVTMNPERHPGESRFVF